MLRTHTTLLIGVSLLASGMISLAQPPKIEEVPAPRELESLGAPKEIKGAPKESPRLMKLRQLSFDRKPSNILKVWNEVNSPPRPALKDSKKEGLEPKADPIAEELKKFQQDVILGRWDRVKEYLKNLPEDEREPAYLAMLSGLQRVLLPGMQPPRPDADPAEMMQMQMEMQQRQQIPPNLLEQPSFSVEDIVGIAAACPTKIEEAQLKMLGTLLSRSLAQGRSVVETAVGKFQELSKLPEGESPLTRRQFAKLLLAANQATYTDGFLPTLEEARTAKDFEALDLLAQHYLQRDSRDKRAIDLEKAWLANQSVLGIPETKPEILDECLKRAISLAPRVKETLGQTWLEESFSKQIDRGREILATLGSRTSLGLSLQPMQPGDRLGELKLQKVAVESLLKSSPERAKEWEPQLTLLAAAWLREAECSRLYDRSLSLGPRMQFDPFGNVFYMNDDEEISPYQRFMPQQGFQAIRIGELLDAMPNEAWLKALEPGFRPKLAQGVASLLLKVKEDVKAFPYIESLAEKYPEKARLLVNEFLRVWTRNHNLNSERQTRNPFIFYYGFERRQEGIPLTRSKQERNLVELAEWVAKLKKLPIGEIDQDLLAKAFTASHSSAEVFRLESIESVFGPLKTIKPRTLSELVQQMRGNLAGVWRDPAAQEDKKTNRKQKDIQQEVLRGYKLALTVVDDARKQFPNDWSLTLAKASLVHDELNYQAELAKSTDFVPRRNEAMTLYQTAAKQYSETVRTLAEEEQSLLPYEQWFYASLGAVDARFIDEDKLTDTRQAEKIRQAIAALPGELAEKHLSRFANGLFTKMSGVKPAAKFRYLKSGFEIVGEHKQAWEARKLYDYYTDLVTEIKLDAVVDGSSKVGHGEPFGLFINIVHTREIERESGGFSRYLQNQNSGRGFFYNYGRPTADYRDKFQTNIKDALKEQFEVISVTFQDEKVNSRATREYGWRFTPYAYVLLKPRGPEVDKIPPMKMDFDFIDTSGYVVLPIATPAVPVDCLPKEGTPRPVSNVQLTQLLDERQAAQGKLIVEVKATGVGLIGDLDAMIDLNPEGFDRKQVIPQPLSITRFNAEANLAIDSERSWMVHFEAKPGTNPKQFRFGTTKQPGIELTLQRYQDADLVNAEPEVELLATYQKKSYTGWILAGVGFLIVLVLGIVLLRRSSKSTNVGPMRYTIPEQLDVFQLLGLLDRVRKENPLNELQRTEMEQTVKLLEKQYFSPDRADSTPGNLRQIAERWVNSSGVR